MDDVEAVDRSAYDWAVAMVGGGFVREVGGVFGCGVAASS
jgi:hypothetical protein